MIGFQNGINLIFSLVIIKVLSFYTMRFRNEVKKKHYYPLIK